MADNYCYNCFTMRAGAGPCPHCGYDPELDRGRHAGALLHGSVLAGRYIVGRVLGQGGFGITYVALDKPSGQKTAIKEYFPASLSSRMAGTSLVTAAGDSGEFFRYGLERFLEEAKLLAQFNGNANIVAVRSFFQENGTAYFAMDYIEGISFKMYLRNHGGRVSWQEAINILRPVMKALAAVHRVGIIHRDVVPDNIYIAGNGEVKLLDFGAARYSLGDRSRSLDVILRPGYAPREQYTSRSRQGPFTDVYSLAACFYAALTGYLPQESLERWERDELVPISRYGVRVPAALEEVIYKGLAVQAEDRFQSMGDFLAALDQATAAANPPPQPPPPPPPKSPQPPPPQQPQKSPQSPQTPQPPPQSPPQPPQPPAQRTFPAGAAVCLAICALVGLGGLGLLLNGSTLCLPAFAAALILGAAAFLLLRQGPQREQRYQDACAAYKTGDFPRAVRLFRQAAGMGDARAKYCLGECFYWGNGVPADMRLAFKWYLEAAKNGNEDAYYKVGCCYCSGDGVDADPNEAIRWLELAAASHSGAAGAARRMLDAMLPYMKR